RSAYSLLIASFGAGRAAEGRLKNCTLAGRDAVGLWSTALTGASPGSVTVISQGNIFAGHATNILETGGIHLSLGYNVSSDATGHLTNEGDLPSTDPLLVPTLLHRGGPTRTFAPM